MTNARTAHKGPISRLLLGTALLVAVAGCERPTAPPVAAEHAAARAADVIPFVSATAERDAASGEFALQWSAPGAGPVAVYAATDPEVADRTNPVGRAGEAGSIRVAGLAPGQRWYFALVPEQGAPLIVADRDLGLKTAPNLRDIGGYRTADGRWVRMGRLFRSDQLDKLSDADLAVLDRVGIGLVADLRTATERAREPDRLPPGAEHLVLDVAADSTNGLGGDMRQASEMIAAGRGIELLTLANRDFVSLPSAQSSYTTLLQRIGADDARPTLYHCTAGKDRTGWASVVVLMLLGVPRETAIEDYLASNHYLQAKNAALLDRLSQGPEAIDPARVEPVLGVRREFIDAAFAEVDRRYGSFDRYVSEALGMDAAAIDRLRERYLIGGPVQS